MKKKHMLTVWLLFLLVACGGSESTAESTLTDNGKRLASGTYSNDSGSWTYEKLRLPNHSGGNTYAHYFQANGPVPRPVIVIAKPYAGIDWSNEPIDSRWVEQYRAHRANGGDFSMCVPDVDGPAYKSNSGNPASICFAPMSTQQIGNEVSLYLTNNIDVLAVYGRFYAGGSIANEIGDMLAGLRFISTRTEIDPQQIGIIGASWGGFESLYAAAKAPAGVRPAVAVPLYPLSDVAGLVDFINNELVSLVSTPVLEQYNRFYDPFLRRIFASTETPPTANYQGYTNSDLARMIRMPMLIAHDDGDTILPARFSHNLVNANPALIEGFWYERRDNAPWETRVSQHGRITDAILEPAYRTFANIFLLSRLNKAGRNIYITYGAQDMATFFNDIHDYQLGARDVSWLVPRLIEMSEPTLFLYEVTPGNMSPIIAGADFVAQTLNSLWGTTLNATTVQSYLRANGLPPV